MSCSLFAAGVDPQSNGHCETEVNQFKGRIQLLLHIAFQENTHWLQAMRYAVEERLRGEMNAFGSPNHFFRISQMFGW
jgi:hypothetical protein